MEFHQLVLVAHVVQLQNKKLSLSFYVHIVSIVPSILPIFLDHLLPKKQYINYIAIDKSSSQVYQKLTNEENLQSCYLHTYIHF